MLLAFGYHGAAYCDVLRYVGCCGLKFENGQFLTQHLWMLHDVLVVWPGSCNSVAPGHAHCLIFNSQHAATRRNTVAKRTQHVAPNNVSICCVEMLRSFHQGLQILGQQCWDMLSCTVAIVWPGVSFENNCAKIYQLDLEIKENGIHSNSPKMKPYGQ